MHVILQCPHTFGFQKTKSGGVNGVKIPQMREEATFLQRLVDLLLMLLIEASVLEHRGSRNCETSLSCVLYMFTYSSLVTFYDYKSVLKEILQFFFPGISGTVIAQHWPKQNEATTLKAEETITMFYLRLKCKNR